MTTQIELPIVLGSSSKWRGEILREQGVPVAEYVAPDIDERAIRSEDPHEMTLLIARAKMESVTAKLKRPAIAITCDQVILWKGQVREKPESPEECRAFLHSYAEAPAVCVSSVVVRNTRTGQQKEAISVAILHFKPIDDAFITSLIAQGDALKCAGGFVVEEMGQYLSSLYGEMETVRGMSGATVVGLLRELGAKY